MSTRPSPAPDAERQRRKSDHRRLIDEAQDRLHRRRIAVWEGRLERTGAVGVPYPNRPTVGELAGLVGVTPTTLYRYRMGDTMPARIASALTLIARTEEPRT